MQQLHSSQITGDSIMVGVSTKMYLGYQDSLEWLEQLRHEVDTRPALAAGRVVPFVIPSFPLLPAAAALLARFPAAAGCAELRLGGRAVDRGSGPVHACGAWRPSR